MEIYKHLPNNLFPLLLVLLFCACSTPVKKDLTFVQLCDPQLGMGGYEHDKKSLNQAVEQINELNPNFVVICGDLVNEASDGSFKDFSNILKKLEVPYYLAPGNHDVGNIPDSVSLKYYRKRIGKDYFVFKEQDVNFIVVNSQLWKIDVINESEKHQKWFINSLDSLARINNSLLVIGHYPLFTLEPNEEEHYYNIPNPLRNNLLNSMSKSNVKAYLSGHKHELLVNAYKDILMLSGESTSKNFDNRPLGFRFWTLKNKDSIKHKFIPLKKL